MTLGYIFGLSLAAIFIIAIVIINLIKYKMDYDVEVIIPYSILMAIISLIIWLAIFIGVTSTDAFSAKSISWAECNISKLEQKIENSDKEYDIIRYQTKIQKWKKNKEYYFNQIKENSEAVNSNSIMKAKYVKQT